jgi:hypothetical protein
VRRRARSGQSRTFGVRSAADRCREDDQAFRYAAGVVEVLAIAAAGCATSERDRGAVTLIGSAALGRTSRRASHRWVRSFGRFGPMAPVVYPAEAANRSMVCATSSSPIQPAEVSVECHLSSVIRPGGRRPSWLDEGTRARGGVADTREQTRPIFRCRS